jgi:hypothetical protein
MPLLSEVTAALREKGNESLAGDLELAGCGLSCIKHGAVSDPFISMLTEHDGIFLSCSECFNLNHCVDDTGIKVSFLA